MGRSAGGSGGWFRAMPWWLQAGVAVGAVFTLGFWALAGLGAALSALGIETEPAEEQVVVETSSTSTPTTREVIRSTTTTTARPTIRTTTSTTSTTAPPPPTTTTTADPFAGLSPEEQAALDAFFNPPPPPPPPPPSGGGCDPNYTGCVPIASDVDCAGGSGNGPAYTSGPVTVIGVDIYGLDADGDGIGCE